MDALVFGSRWLSSHCCCYGRLRRRCRKLIKICVWALARRIHMLDPLATVLMNNSEWTFDFREFPQRVSVWWFDWKLEMVLFVWKGKWIAAHFYNLCAECRWCEPQRGGLSEYSSKKFDFFREEHYMKMRCKTERVLCAAGALVRFHY